MTLDLDIVAVLNILLFLGVVQGLIVAVLLLFVKKPGSISDRLLSFWVLVLALTNGRIIIEAGNLYQVFGLENTLMAPLSFELWYGPLLYLFVLSLTSPSFSFEKKHLWHLAPGLLEFLYYLVAYVQPLEIRLPFYGNIHWKWVEPGIEIVAVLSFAIYLLLSGQRLKSYKLWLHENYAAPELDAFGWLHRLIRVLLVMLAFWLVLTVIDVAFMGYRLEFIYFYPYYIIIAYLSYFIGYAGYFRPQTIILTEKKRNATTKEVLDKDRLNKVVAQLTLVMQQDQLFLNQVLKASDVAGKLDISVQALSYALNQGLGLSFNDYVNQLRIAHVKERLASQDLAWMSLMGIARESGFNSESSFYRIFKQQTGMTPKGYVQHLKAQKGS